MKKPIVFVSSTIKGMEQRRSLVKRLIENDIGYEAIISESEGSKPKKPIVQCRKWAKECDVFIALLGDKYGWIIPQLGISVSEMEFNEAIKDNPEKILVYVLKGRKDKRQAQFVKRIEDFNQGYFRREPFSNENELGDGIKSDLSEFVKDRLDYIRSKKLRIKPIITPSINEYATLNLKNRQEKMLEDTIEVATKMGFKQVIHIKPYFWLATKNINRLNVLFTIYVIHGVFNRNELRAYNMSYQHYVKYNELYKKYPNRFAIILVHGNAGQRTLEWTTEYFSGTCFKVEPGLFYGESLSTAKIKPGSMFFENRLVLSQIINKGAIHSKLSDTLEWLSKEAYRINFKCNYKN